MSNWVTLKRPYPWRQYLTLNKKYEVVSFRGLGMLKLIDNRGLLCYYNRRYFKPCTPPSSEMKKKIRCTGDKLEAYPEPLKPTDPVPEFCYHVTNKALKINRCSFVTERTKSGETSYILLAHGGKREFGDTYGEYEYASIVAKKLWGIF